MKKNKIKNYLDNFNIYSNNVNLDALLFVEIFS